MKFALSTAVLLLLLGTTAPAYAQQDKGQGGHPQEAKPAQQQAKPAQQQHQQAKPAARQQTQNSKPAQQQQRQQTQNARPAQQQHTQQATRSQQGNGGRTQARAQQSHPARGNNGGNEHGRISNDHYAASFGSGHSFHVNRGDYDHRRFQYGGYAFGFIDPWPVAWGYSDDVYVVYMDGGYYMYNRVHPGVRISINIL